MGFVLKPNAVKVAVDRVGGPTKASVLLGVSNWTIHSWIRLQRISNIDYARTLANLSGLKTEDLRPTY